MADTSNGVDARKQYTNDDVFCKLENLVEEEKRAWARFEEARERCQANADRRLGDWKQGDDPRIFAERLMFGDDWVQNCRAFYEVARIRLAIAHVLGVELVWGDGEPVDLADLRHEGELGARREDDR